MNRFQLDAMLTRWMAGELSSDEHAQLEAVLQSDAKSRQRLREHAMLDEILLEMGDAKPSDMGPSHAEEARPAESRPKPALPMIEPVGGWGVTSSLIFFSTLAMVALGFIAWPWQRPVQEAKIEIPKISAPVISVDPPAVKQLPPISSIKLASGATELALPGVGRVIVEGPSDFELIGPKRARLTRGRIKFRITDLTGRGFVVETPYGEVTDLGTEFGLDVSGTGKAGLVVFDGMVDLRMNEEPRDAAALRLVGGDGVTFDRGGQLDRIMSIVTGGSATFQPADESFADETSQLRPISAGVSDNLPASATKRFYEIVRGGFGEDVRAYVDRNYEWNGIDERGIPEFLRGADYILPFNEDKVKQLEISLAIARPAVVYVLFDDRGRPPRWLRRDFIDTGLDIGLDEDKGPPGNTRPGLAVDRGPGKSIDHIFSIWKREVPVPGKVVLGPRDGVPGRRAMYGIAITPLETERTALAMPR